MKGFRIVDEQKIVEETTYNKKQEANIKKQEKKYGSAPAELEC